VTVFDLGFWGHFLLLALAFAGMQPSCAHAQLDPARVKALQNYLLKEDYPELFAKSPYRTRIEGVLDVDVDNDGNKELVVLFYPHYLQSAPIVIYKIDANGVVKRVTEGIAPGPVRPISGDYLDSHAVGSGADFTISGGKSDPAGIIGVLKKSGVGGLVIYDHFYHMDGRSGAPAVVDMRGVKLPPGTLDCSKFEFSRVKQIAAGGLREDPSKNYLAAWVGNEVDVYLIRGISADGLLDKTKWVVKAPAGFKGFDPGHGLSYTVGSQTSVLSLK